MVSLDISTLKKKKKGSIKEFQERKDIILFSHYFSLSLWIDSNYRENLIKSFASCYLIFIPLNTFIHSFVNVFFSRFKKNRIQATLKKTAQYAESNRKIPRMEKKKTGIFLFYQSTIVNFTIENSFRDIDIYIINT